MEEHFSNYSKKKRSDQCSIVQHKAGFNQLPDSTRYEFRLETSISKKALKRLMKNPRTQDELFKSLDKMHNDELLPRNKKDFKRYGSLTEYKFNDLRMLVREGKNNVPDTIIAIVHRNDLTKVSESKSLKKNINNNLKELNED